MKQDWQKGFSLIGFLVVLVVLAVIVTGGYLWVRSQMANTPVQQNQTTQGSDSGQPDIPVTDLAPSLPNNQKTAVIIMKSDSSKHEYIMSNAAVAGYINALPPGDHLVSQTPLGQ